MELMKKVFKIDLENCPKCKNGKMIIIAAIVRVDVIRKILKHLKMDSEPPKIEPSKYEIEYDNC